MNKTLNIDTDLLERAFAVAAKLNIDLSSQVEKFIQRFVSQSNDSEIEITPFVAGLGIDIPAIDDRKIKEDYRDYLEEKYK